MKKKKESKCDFLEIDSDESFAFIAGYTAGGFAYGIIHDKPENIDKDDYMTFLNINEKRNMTTTKRYTIIGICITSFLFVCLMTDLFGLIHLEKNVTSKWIEETEFWIFLGLVFFTALKIEKTKLLLWQETKRKWYFYPLSVIFVFTGAVIVAITVPIIFKFFELPINQNVLKSTVNFYCIDKILMIFACLTAGVVEEFIFRGYLMPRLEILFKHGWLVVVLSSLLFGIAHISGLSLVGVIVPILIGFVFSFHYYKYRNLIVLIVAHFLIDFASFITSC